MAENTNPTKRKTEEKESANKRQSLNNEEEILDIEKENEGGAVSREDDRIGCLRLMPVYTWNRVFDYLESDKDNVKRAADALPDLSFESYFQKRKKEWYFVDGFTIVADWVREGEVTEKQLLGLRTQGNKLKDQIDEFLENQPALNAYHPGDLSSEFPVPERDRYYYPTCTTPVSLDRIWNLKSYKNKVIGTWTMTKSDYYGGVYLRLDHVEGDTPWAKRKTVAKLLSSRRFPWDENPILSRMLTLQVSKAPEAEDEDDDEDELTYTNMYHSRWDFIHFSVRLGHHVWFLKFLLVIGDMDANVFRNFLAGLPNLKSLELKLLAPIKETSPEAIYELLISADLDRILPEMQNLETLKIGTLNYRMAKVFLERYSNQLYWVQFKLFPLERYVGVLRARVMFPKLTELELVLTNEIYLSFATTNFTPTSYLLYFLEHLETENLTRLELIGPEYSEGSLFDFYIDQLVLSCHRHKKLLLLNVGTCASGIVFHDQHLQYLDEKQLSCEFLSIRDNPDLTYNFLKSFQKLKKLQIFINRIPNPLASQSRLTNVRLRKEIEARAIYRSNVWKLLPRLEEVELVQETMGHLEATFTFGRTEYEKMQLSRIM